MSKKCEESAHHGLSKVVRPSAIQHRTSLLKCRMALNPTNVHSCNFMPFCIFKHSLDPFLTLLNTRKDFFWLNWDIQICLTHLFSQKSSLALLFSKIDQIKIIHAHEYISQTRGIRPCLIHFKKKKKTTIIICSKKKNQSSKF